MSETAILYPGLSKHGRRADYPAIERSGDFAIPVNYTILGSDYTNKLLDVRLDISKCVFFWAYCADFAVVLKTNSSSSPTNTLTLIAGEPYVWRANGYSSDAFVLTGDITAGIYATGESGVDHEVEIFAVVDSSLS